MADPVKPDDTPAISPSGAVTAPQAQPSGEPAATLSGQPSSPAAQPADASATPAAPAAGESAKQAEPELTPTLLAKTDQEAAAKAAADAAAKPADAAKDGPKPDDKAKDAAAKPEGDAKPAEAAKPEPVEYKYTLPDTLKMDDALKAKVHTAFDEFRADPAAGAQKLIDLHNETMQQYAADLRTQTIRNQITTFNDTKSDWEKKILADPEFGGAGHKTAAGAVARVRDALISSAKPGSEQYKADLAAFEEFDRYTGAGSHPAFWRILHNAARFVDEPQASSAPVNIKPPPGNGRPPKSGIYSEDSLRKMNT